MTGQEAAKRAAEIIHRLKHPRGSLERIPVPGPGGTPALFLRPAPAAATGEAARDPALMALWRNRKRESFFSWVEASEEKNRRWLEGVYGDALEIIFMAVTPDGRPFGHLSLYNFDFSARSGEWGRLVRGENLGPRGGMSLAARAMMDWGFETLCLDLIFCEVFEHNRASLDLCERIGFRTTARVPLARRDEAGLVRWDHFGPNDANRPPDGWAARMELKRPAGQPR
ncbi:MAG: GNAT family N-acetyltransferase [Pseudomonadota bacterium]